MTHIIHGWSVAMKRFVLLVSCVGLLAAPFAARAESAATALGVVGPGPHGYDWLIGTWSCVNTNPSALAGPGSSTFTATRTGASDALFIRATGKHFDTAAYLSYDRKTKTWSDPAAFSDGSYEFESSTDTGAKFVFTGSYYHAGSITKVRDLYTLLSATRQIDIGQARSGGVWKTTYDVTCTKS